MYEWKSYYVVETVLVGDPLYYQNKAHNSFSGYSHLWHEVDLCYQMWQVY